VAAKHDFCGSGGEAAGGALVRGALRTAIKTSGHRVVVSREGSQGMTEAALGVSGRRRAVTRIV
jgi:6-phosphofructokinase